MALVKTVNGLALASVKTRNGLAASLVKTINGLDSAASATEQIWQTPYGSTTQQQTTDEDYAAFGSGTIVDQYINNTDSSSRTVTRVSLLINEISGSAKNVTCDLRSASNGGGSSYGSATVSVSYTGAPVWVDFVLSASIPASTNFYVSASCSTSERWQRGHGDYSGNLYVSSTYCQYSGGVASTSYDLCFKIYITV